MATKPKPSKRKRAPKKVTAKKKSTTIAKSTRKSTHKGGRKPDKRVIRSKKVAENNQRFGQIQHEVLDEFYEAGVKNKPRPDVKETYKKVTKRLFK